MNMSFSVGRQNEFKGKKMTVETILEQIGKTSFFSEVQLPTQKIDNS